MKNEQKYRYKDNAAANTDYRPKDTCQKTGGSQSCDL
jgi:hypothetical protein